MAEFYPRLVEKRWGDICGYRQQQSTTPQMAERLTGVSRTFRQHLLDIEWTNCHTNIYFTNVHVLALWVFGCRSFHSP